MKQSKKIVSITLDDDVIKKLKILAMNDGRSLSEYINMVIKEYITIEKEDSSIT